MPAYLPFCLPLCVSLHPTWAPQTLHPMKIHPKMQLWRLISSRSLSLHIGCNNSKRYFNQISWKSKFLCFLFISEYLFSPVDTYVFGIIDIFFYFLFLKFSFGSVILFCLIMSWFIITHGGIHRLSWLVQIES